ncbi:hypothetical protein GCM10010923_18360 [Blastomonas marina]|uniref:6-phosphogluconate dehydrogenase NADP-binding domain-containing protein n=1 Tax=Blastomonas marina TaxID=1867408 RepID=A0ABQ1FE38_9SPHN|nr:NAD(P)-binding domain-containing protein [Blastomonas marina]GGA08453.1 hypothetical protein GCM10010923_18360 [Blastomonas marina]
MGDGKRIFFLGLGPIGGAIARRLAAAGHEVIVYDRSDDRADAWVASDDSGAIRVPTPASGAEGADGVIACLDRDEDIEAMFLDEDGALAAMRKDAVLIDHTAGPIRIVRLLAQDGSAHGVHLVDAPVACGRAEDENGTLAIACDCSEEALALARPIMDAYAARIIHAGAAGSGQAAAMANQERV